MNRKTAMSLKPSDEIAAVAVRQQHPHVFPSLTVVSVDEERARIVVAEKVYRFNDDIHAVPWSDYYPLETAVKMVEDAKIRSRLRLEEERQAKINALPWRIEVLHAQKNGIRLAYNADRDVYEIAASTREIRAAVDAIIASRS